MRMVDLKRTLGLASLALAVAWTAVAQEPARIPAFPGAEGFGAFTTGGRGGKVMLVTNLKDYDEDELPIPGSLREAIEENGPRTILFRTSGNIALKRPLVVSNPYVTIAGQSAPGAGVAITGYGIDIDAPEVIIRYLRIRPGDVTGEELDAINIRSQNVIIDHCSASWATDETVSVIGDATDVTVQWCLISESLNESVHSKGAHGYGSLISTSGRVTIHHTGYLLHQSRSPRPRNGLLDFRNNVIYGWGDRAGYNADDRTRMNYVANYLQPLSYSGNDEYAFILGGPDSRLYLEGNIFRGEEGTRLDDWTMVRPPNGVHVSKLESTVGAELPFPAPSVTTHSALMAYELVLNRAGATLPRRDSVDQRLIDLVKTTRGEIIDSQWDVSGWPALYSEPPPADADADGLPDAWEVRYGLDPHTAADQAYDEDGDGYTNLEEFLNETDPSTPYGWVEAPMIQPHAGTAFTVAPLMVSITPSVPDLPIYYTIDGREPTVKSQRYSEPIPVTASAHVRAKSIHDDRPTTAAYAAYEYLPWIPPIVLGKTADGLEYAVYEAEDWDEGPPLRELRPLERGISPGVDLDLHEAEGGSGIVFEGLIDIPRDGIYSFFLSDDARSELRVAGRFVTNGRPPSSEPGRIALRAGLHKFELRSLHEEPRAAKLMWSGPDFDLEPIPAGMLRRMDT